MEIKKFLVKVPCGIYDLLFGETKFVKVPCGIYDFLVGREQQKRRKKKKKRKKIFLSTFHLEFLTLHALRVFMVL